MNRLILISVVILTQLLSTICFSQNINLENFKYTYLGIEQGASNNFITDIYQDQKGFIWIGTYDGLNRYDGYDFISYRNQPNDSTSLSNNRIVSI
jgi:ligand-binding sensor domain-containing protein